REFHAEIMGRKLRSAQEYPELALEKVRQGRPKLVQEQLDKLRSCLLELARGSSHEDEGTMGVDHLSADRPAGDHLLKEIFLLFPEADRGMVIACWGDRYAVIAEQLRDASPAEFVSLPGREPRPGTDLPFDPSLVRRALEVRVGLISEDCSL